MKTRYSNNVAINTIKRSGGDKISFLYEIRLAIRKTHK